MRTRREPWRGSSRHERISSMNATSQVAVTIFSLSISILAYAQAKPIPTAQWTTQARITLARAMVAEAGFRSKRDHAAIAWVLAERYRRWARVSPLLASFAKMVASYCTGMDKWIPERLKKRLTWIRALSDPQPKAPSGWPKRKYGKWDNRWETRWSRVLERADAWSRGEIADPCRGRAIHWGGKTDRVLSSSKWKKLDCGKTVNTYYRLKRIQKARQHVPIEDQNTKPKKDQ